MLFRLPTLLLLTSSIAACGVHELPAPAPPPATVPVIADVPSDPPPPGTGRLLIASEGEPARVARVTEVWQGTAVDPIARRRYGTYPVLEARKTELVCMTPCAVDMPTGAADLVFTSLADPQRTSTAEIAIPHGTTVVRHAIGTDKPVSHGYVAGVGMTASGIVLGLAGAAFLGTGLAIDSTPNGPDLKNTITTTGAVISIAAAGALIAGIVMMTQNQPERGPGATTTFRVP